MAEPIATSVMSSLPRHIARKGSLVRVVKTASRPSFSAKFFTPIPRQIPSQVDPPPLESVLDYRTWAYPISKQLLWREDGLMRSLLLTELLPAQPSGRRVRRISQSSRIRLRKPVSLHTSTNRLSFSTGASVNNTQLKHRPHIPLSRQIISDIDLESPLERFRDFIHHRAKSRQDLQLTLNMFTSAKDQGAFSSMAPQDVFKLAEDLADFIDQLCADQVQVEVIIDWGERLQELLEHIPSGSGSVSHSDLPRMSLLSRASSHVGHFHQAQELFLGLPPSTKRRQLRKNSDPYQQAYESLVLSMHRHEGLYLALYFMFVKNKWFSHGITFARLLRDMITQSSSIKDVFPLATKWNTSAYGRMLQEVTLACNEAKAFDKTSEIINEQYALGLKVPAHLLLHTTQGLASTGNIVAAQKLFDLVPPEETQLYEWVNLFLLSRRGDSMAVDDILSKREGVELQDKEITTSLYPLAAEGNVKEIRIAFDRFFPKDASGIRMRKPDAHHYTLVVQAHSRRAVIRGLGELLEDMQNHGVEPDLHILTNIIGIYRRKCDIAGVLNTYQYMRKTGFKLDCIAYTVVIGALAAAKDSENATQVYMQAVEDGLVPDDRMTNSLMNAYVETGSLKEAVAIFHYLTSLPADRLPPIDTFNTILKGYVLVGAPFRLISKLFFRLQAIGAKPDGHTFSTLILSATDAGELDIAHGIYEEMKSLEDSGEQSNLISQHVLTILMSAYLQRRNLVKGKEILDEMTARDCPPTAVTYRAIIAAYGNGKETDWEESMRVAEDFVKQVQEEDRAEPYNTRRPPLLHYYAPLIINYCGKGNITEVERLYSEYLNAGGEPTIVLLEHLLRCYGLRGDTTNAIGVWTLIRELAESQDIDGGVLGGEMMKTKFGDIHFGLSMYTDILSKSGLHSKIASTWAELQSQNFEFDSHNWNHLVVALIRAGQVERAFEIVEGILIPRGKESELVNEVIKTRNASELETKVDIAANTPVPPVEHPLRNLSKRTDAAQNDKLTHQWIVDLLEDDEAIDADFSYPLQILQIISPQWNTWRPHSVVLRALLVVVLQLQRGYPIRPIQPGEIAAHNVAGSDMSEQDFEATESLLQTLYTKYPQTSARVRQFHAREANRLAATKFEQIYTRR